MDENLDDFSHPEGFFFSEENSVPKQLEALALQPLFQPCGSLLAALFVSTKLHART